MSFTDQQLLTARTTLARMWFDLLEDVVLAANDEEPDVKVIANLCRSLSEIGSGVETLRYAPLEAPPSPNEEQWLDHLAELLAQAHGALTRDPRTDTECSRLMRDAYLMIEERLEEIRRSSAATPKINA